METTAAWLLVRTHTTNLAATTNVKEFNLALGPVHNKKLEPRGDDVPGPYQNLGLSYL